VTPTIRIDEDVYRWLQEQAVPFHDNANSVLRRIAGLDPGIEQYGARSRETPDQMEKSMTTRARKPPLARGQDLIRKWKLDVRQARFHRDGTFYENPSELPVALCDCNGYVLFESKADLVNHPKIKIGVKLNVMGGISSMREYVRVVKDLAIAK